MLAPTQANIQDEHMPSPPPPFAHQPDLSLTSDDASSGCHAVELEDTNPGGASSGGNAVEIEFIWVEQDDRSRVVPKEEIMGYWAVWKGGLVHNSWGAMASQLKASQYTNGVLHILGHHDRRRVVAWSEGERTNRWSRIASASPAINAAYKRNPFWSHQLPPVKRARQEAIDAFERQHREERDALVDNERYEMQDLEEEPEEEGPRVQDANKPADPAMNDWLRNHHDTFLRAMLWREGRRSIEMACPDCGGSADVRCRDCFGGLLFCEACCAKAHLRNPLHVVEKWTGAYFARHSLRACGLRIQFGHATGHRCPIPRRGRNDFVVIGDDGIHEVAVDFCGCYLTNDPDFVQILRAGWFPSTTTSPRTAATLTCLERFQTLSLHGKISAYDYYAALETLTNGAGIKPPDRYRVFLRLARQYRHVVMLKRGGRGHDRSGVFGTSPGELAVRCPVCPRPDVNLPEGWRDTPVEMQFLYTLWIALDACFGLKRRLISSWAKDPPSGPGWAFMTEPFSYEAFLQTVTEQDDMSTCSGLAAVELANSKFSRGYAATGVGMGVCARHEFVFPTSVCDLQRGERYANMDYVFLQLLQHICLLLWMIVSYDIVCQWIKKLLERVKALEPRFRIRVIWALVRFVIPKLHILGHIAKCRTRFSLLLLRGGAQTDGEGIERPWSNIRGVVASTRASGPGSRADQLDDHWGFWNWRKVIGLPALLCRRIDKAELDLAAQEESLAAFSKEQAEFIAEWTRMIQEWEEDPSKPNPFEGTATGGLSERAVREQLEQQEAEAEAAGAARIHDVGLTEFVVSLLTVEEEQRRVRALAELKSAQSTTMKISLRRDRKRLNKNIAAIRAMQATYMPAALRVLEALSLPQETLAEKVPLLPPSALSAAQSCAMPSGRAAIAGVRSQLHMKYRLLLHKKQHVRHQGPTTRSRTTIARNESKILLHSDKYQSARRALLQIASTRENGENDATVDKASGVAWPELRKEDIRYLDDSDEGNWMVDDDEVFGSEQGTPGTGEKADGSFRGYGALPGKRARTPNYANPSGSNGPKPTRERIGGARRSWWEERWQGVAALDLPEDVAEGLRAYAAKQADVLRDLARRAEVIRTQPRLRRGMTRPRESAQVYRCDGSDVTVLVASAESLDGNIGDGGVDEGEEYFEPEPVDEHGNASDEDDDKDGA
ncbi:CxC2 domain-containing protein [Mycena kentingensis (nom. inval.)]|nr:CxC2 domain-containing protein [Mycena kentingensis (nom. inval.)]